VFLINEMSLVAFETNAKDAPHVIDEIRIKEVHRPSMARRRKATEHQQASH
jgi:hypothetical protein